MSIAPEANANSLEPGIYISDAYNLPGEYSKSILSFSHA